MANKGVLILAVVLLLLLAHISLSYSLKLTIYPSCSGRSESCLTLNSLSSHMAPVISLIFAPGIHRYTSSSNLAFRNARFIEFKALSSNAKTTVMCRSPYWSRICIQIRNSKNISVTGLTFSDCYLYISGSRNIVISTSKFINNHYSVLNVHYSHNITVDRCTFLNNSDSTYRSIIQFSQSSAIKYTRNNFTYNTISSNGGVTFVHSKGFVGCCNFHYNYVSSYEYGIIALQSSSLITVTNSTFDDKSVLSSSSILTLKSAGDSLVIVSSSFTVGTNNRYNRLLYLGDSGASATIIASKFVGAYSTSRYQWYHSPIYSMSRDIAVYCTTFINMTLPLQYFKNRAGLCEQYRGPDAETCENSQCQSKYYK